MANYKFSTPKNSSTRQRLSRKAAFPFVTLVFLLCCSLVLSACSIDSPKVVTATPNAAQRAQAQKALEATITPLPPLPTATPRPTLATTNFKLTKATLMQAAFETLINSYFYPVQSSNVYELSLRGLIPALTNAGVANPVVPIPDFTGDATKDWQSFIQAFALTAEKYQSQLSEEQLAYIAIKAGVGSLGECKTAYYTPTEAEDFVKNLTGTAPVVGLGVVVITPAGGEGLYIGRVVPSSPAEKAGIQVGDAIRGVDNQSIVGMDLGQASRLLVGGDRPVPGTTVNLDIRKAVTQEDKKIQVTRGSTTVQVFETQVIDRVGYLKINNFSRRTTQGLIDLNTELDKKLKDMTAQNIRGLVIDLRGVRYGYYVTMNNVLSRFIAGQQLMIIGARNNTGGFAQLGVSSISGITPLKLPLAVVVDNTTLAEGEIFALALQENKAARVFGQPTGGCAVGSETVSLPDKSVLNIAVFRPILNSDPTVSFIEGVLPDEQVTQNVKDLQQGKDTVLEKALAYIKSI